MRQALEMALEALSKVGYVPDAVNPHPIFVAITAIKEALAQPEQEPMGYWMGKFSDGAATLYKVPQESLLGYTYQNIPVYTTPPQRKPLTNGEIYTAYITATNQTLRAQDERLAFAFARAIEAAHNIKE